MSPAHRWFELLLRLFPARFRARHGDDMREAFDTALEDHRARGRASTGAFLFRTTLDLVGAGARERLAPRARRERPSELARGGLVSWLDVKLGVRMLAKHPGLTAVCVVALAVGIPVGLAPAHFADGIVAPLPVPEGDRVRLLRVWSPARGQATETTQLDYEAWRPALASFEDVGAFREVAWNLDAGEGGGSTVRGAEVTASTFMLLRTRPLLGRVIQPGDEVPGGEPVVVLGYDVWQARYGGDPSLVGRTIRVGSVPHTVVGVMPKGFLFPRRQSVWTPLRLTAVGDAEEAMPLTVFGRLADGVTDQAADAEFRLAARATSSFDRDPRAVGRVVPFAHIVMPGLDGGLRSTPEFMGFQTLALLVLLVACVNVGMLIFARTSTRAGELAVRTALGASRVRIVAQIFTECLVLAVVASGLGLLLLKVALDGIWWVLPTRAAAFLPYWIDWSIDGHTALRALGLACLSAVFAGVVPAVRFTGRSVQGTIQRARARRTGVRFGGLSGALIVLDVAVAVGAIGFAATAWDIARATARGQDTTVIPAQEFLAVNLTVPSVGAEAPPGARAQRTAATQEELVRRLRAEPGVQAVAVADALPRMTHRSRRVEVEGIEPVGDRPGVSVRVASIDIDFFASLDQPVLVGRDFNTGDLGDDRSAVIVNTTFVETVLGGQNAVGRRIRFRPWGDGEPGPWKEIVGVVGHLGMRTISESSDHGVYEPFAPGELTSVSLGVRVGEDPAAFAPRLREVAGAVDPEAIVSVIGPLDEVREGDWYLLLASTLGAALLVGVLLALAASGIYAIMSFAVAERTREIGIRAALGAGRLELAQSVATRAVAQLGLGVALGMPLAALFFASGRSSMWTGAGGTLAVGVAVMLLVGLAACTGPTLRALRVEPGTALNGDG